MNQVLKLVLLMTLSFIIPCIGHAQSKTASSIERGQKIYKNECVSCHMEDGQGIMGAFPPLANSDYFSNDISKAVDAILEGLEGELTVNGNTYFGVMEPVDLSDQEVADVLNYIRTSWNKDEEEMTANEIKKLRAK